MPKEIDQYIAQKIQERKEKDSFRSFQVNENLIDFCSNDYLGFAKDLELANAIHQKVVELSGNVNGSTGARTITGTSNELTELEHQIASFHKGEASLFYNSGYTANLGLFASLPYRGDTILYDELIHASIRDGMQLSKAKSYSFKHNDCIDLEKRLARTTGKVYVAVESIYSMDGDEAPLREIAAICKKYDAALIVDEAHSNGIFGENGSGKVSEYGLEKLVFARVMTFGKAIGFHGAAVVGAQKLKEFLTNYSRSFIYTTAPSLHQVIGVKMAYDKLSISEHKMQFLRELISLFKSLIHDADGVDLIESFSPIQCVIIPGNSRVKALCKAIQADGFDVRPIVAPTVPTGKERIRICLHAYNNKAEVKLLVNSLNKNLKYE